MDQTLDAQQWQEDLDHLVEALRREHRNLFHSLSPEAFQDAVRALCRRIPSLAAHEVVVALAGLVAAIGDGHTTLRLAEVPGFRRYPLTLYHFSDGLAVRAITPQYAVAAGARLLAIDGTPADHAYAAMRPLISRDNELGVTANAPALLTIPEVLHARGVAREPDRAEFTCQLRTGERLNLHLAAVPTLPVDLIDANHEATSPLPLWLQQPGGANWCRHLPETRALYVAFQRVRDSEEATLAAFFDRVFADIEREEVDRLVLDIRLNGGGNNLLNQPLIHHIIRCDRINRWGGLFAIIGRQTFSAAMNLAVDLERHIRVIFAGEPTGSSPNHYGEVGEIILPHSKLRVIASVLYWQSSQPFDDRPWIPPELPAWLSLDDYLANRDPALDAVLNWRPGQTLPLDYPDRLMVQLLGSDAKTGAG